MPDNYGFPVGTRVVMSRKDPTDYVRIGMTGVVCHIVDIDQFSCNCNIGVRWDEHHSGYHSCNGRCDSGYGRYVPHTCLAMEYIDLGEIQTSEFSISALFDITS